MFEYYVASVYYSRSCFIGWRLDALINQMSPLYGVKTKHVHEMNPYGRGSQLIFGKGQIVLTKMRKGQMLRTGLPLPPQDYESRGLSV